MVELSRFGGMNKVKMRSVAHWLELLANVYSAKNDLCRVGKITSNDSSNSTLHRAAQLNNWKFFGEETRQI
jgi:hypothetical protein